MYVMMSHMRLHEKLKSILWCECDKTMTKIWTIMVNLKKGKFHTRISMERLLSMKKIKGIFGKWEWYKV